MGALTRLPDVPIHPNETKVASQPGPQTLFLKCNADVAGYGGSAGGGKSWALLLDNLRYAALQPVAGFGAVIFRRTAPQIMQEGGLWDEAGRLYSLAGGVPKQTRFEYLWARHKTKIRFAHMQYEVDKFNWQGSQIARISFDEATHFTRGQVMYMFSRNRSMCGVKPVIRMTMNPDPDSWCKLFFAPWVDDTYPRPARSGELRYFIMEGDEQVWLKQGEKHPDAKSCTFIFASVYDNPILLETNPDYLKSLKALPFVERQRLLHGDWNIRVSGNMFKRQWFKLTSTAPAQFEKVVRYWDLAATEDTGANDPDYTVGVKMGRKDGIFYVLDVQRDRMSPGQVERLICTTAVLDGPKCSIWMEQEPGSSGVNTIARYRKLLAGYNFHGNKTTGSKDDRAAPVSSQAEGGNIVLVQSPWNETYINEHTAFPTKGVHDDIVDANSGAFEQLALPKGAGVLFAVASEEEQPNIEALNRWEEQASDIEWYNQAA